MNKLKEIRELRGYTQDELGEKISMTGVSISLLERGKRNLTMDTIDKLSKALDCSMAQLLGEEQISEKETSIKGMQRSLNVVSNNEYPIKDEYLGYAMEIIDEMIDHDFHSREEKTHILSEVYKIVYDFYENQDDKTDFAKELESKILANQGVLKFINKIDLGKKITSKLLDKKNKKIGKH